MNLADQLLQSYYNKIQKNITLTDSQIEYSYSIYNAIYFPLTQKSNYTYQHNILEGSIVQMIKLIQTHNKKIQLEQKQKNSLVTLKEYLILQLQSNPNIAVNYWSLAHQFMIEGDYPSANKYLVQSLKFSGEQKLNILYPTIGCMHLLMGQYQKSQQYLSKMTYQQMDNEIINYMHGYIKILSNKYKQAIEIYQTALKKNARSNSALLGMTLAQMYEGNYQQALKYINKVRLIDCGYLKLRSDIAYMMNDMNLGYLLSLMAAKFISFLLPQIGNLYEFQSSLRLSPNICLKKLNKNKQVMTKNAANIIDKEKDFITNIVNFANSVLINQLSQALDYLKSCLFKQVGFINISHFCKFHQACKQYGRQDLINQIFIVFDSFKFKIQQNKGSSWQKKFQPNLGRFIKYFEGCLFYLSISQQSKGRKGVSYCFNILKRLQSYQDSNQNGMFERVVMQINSIFNGLQNKTIEVEYLIQYFKWAGDKNNYSQGDFSKLILFLRKYYKLNEEVKASQIFTLFYNKELLNYEEEEVRMMVSNYMFVQLIRTDQSEAINVFRWLCKQEHMYKGLPDQHRFTDYYLKYRINDLILVGNQCRKAQLIEKNIQQAKQFLSKKAVTNIKNLSEKIEWYRALLKNQKHIQTVKNQLRKILACQRIDSKGRISKRTYEQLQKYINFFDFQQILTKITQSKKSEVIQKIVTFLVKLQLCKTILGQLQSYCLMQSEQENLYLLVRSIMEKFQIIDVKQRLLYIFGKKFDESDSDQEKKSMSDMSYQNGVFSVDINKEIIANSLKKEHHAFILDLLKNIFLISNYLTRRNQSYNHIVKFYNKREWCQQYQNLSYNLQFKLKMEYIQDLQIQIKDAEERTLSYIRRSKERIFDFIVQFAKAIMELKQLGIFHGDLAFRNLGFKLNILKLVDFDQSFKVTLGIRDIPEEPSYLQTKQIIKQILLSAENGWIQDIFPQFLFKSIKYPPRNQFINTLRNKLANGLSKIPSINRKVEYFIQFLSQYCDQWHRLQYCRLVEVLIEYDQSYQQHFLSAEQVEYMFVKLRILREGSIDYFNFVDSMEILKLSQASQELKLELKKTIKILNPYSSNIQNTQEFKQQTTQKRQLYNIANKMFRTNKIESARQVFTKILNRWPEQKKTNLQLAHCLFLSKQYQKGFRYLHIGYEIIDQECFLFKKTSQFYSILSKQDEKKWVKGLLISFQKLVNTKTHLMKLMLGLFYRLVNKKSKAIDAFSQYFAHYLGVNSLFTPSECSSRIKEDWQKIEPYLKNLNFASQQKIALEIALINRLINNNTQSKRLYIIYWRRFQRQQKISQASMQFIKSINDQVLPRDHLLQFLHLYFIFGFINQENPATGFKLLKFLLKQYRQEFEVRQCLETIDNFKKANLMVLFSNQYCSIPQYIKKHIRIEQSILQESLNTLQLIEDKKGITNELQSILDEKIFPFFKQKQFNHVFKDLIGSISIQSFVDELIEQNQLISVRALSYVEDILVRLSSVHCVLSRVATCCERTDILSKIEEMLREKFLRNDLSSQSMKLQLAKIFALQQSIKESNHLRDLKSKIQYYQLGSTVYLNLNFGKFDFTGAY